MLQDQHSFPGAIESEPLAADLQHPMEALKLKMVQS